MPIVPHHAIPLSPPETQAAHTTPPIPSNASAVAGAVGTLSEAVGEPAAAAHHAVDPLLALALTGAAFIAATAMVMLLFHRSTKPLAKARPSQPAEGPRPGSYTYDGLRAEARRVFLGLRRAVGSRLGYEPVWATARELASLAGSSAARAFARIYEKVMYAPSPPRGGVLEELRRLAREASAGPPQAARDASGER